MAEERDPLVSRRYRELGSEEPPAGLDERILARSRRRRSFQWHGPVAAAAVIVLAVAVTVHVERAQPPAEMVVPAPPEAARALKEEAQESKPYEQAQPAEKVQRSEPPATATAPTAPPASGSREETRSRRDVARESAARETAPGAPPPVAQEAPSERALEAQRAPAAGAAADSAAKPMASPESRLAKLAEQSPERWLEGIVELRARGRHAEADESFKRFRERYPDYAIPDEMKAKVERR